MKTLQLIYRKTSNTPTVELLTASGQQRGIDVRSISSNDFDFSTRQHLTSDDGLYRIGDNPESFVVEKFLLNDQVTTFYTDYRSGVSDIDNVLEATLLHEKRGLPVIPTIYALSKDKGLLKRYAEHLGGFPLIIKSTGGQHGVGVMRIDSIESFNSVADYLLQQRDGFIVRKYIDYQSHARLIVLGNQVIDAIEYQRVDDDFRSNAGENLQVSGKDFGEEINRIAVEATHALGYEFAGVDILLNRDGTPYIAEVNFPCYFPRAQHTTGVDISGQMIDYLIAKSQGTLS